MMGSGDGRDGPATGPTSIGEAPEDATQPKPETQSTAGTPERRSWLERTLRVRSGHLPDELGILIALIVLIGVIASGAPGFLLPSNLLLLVRGASFFGSSHSAWCS